MNRAFESSVAAVQSKTGSDAMSVNELELPLADDNEASEADDDDYSKQEIEDALRSLSLVPDEQRDL